MAPWAVGTLVTVRVQKADGTLVDISDDVRTVERARPAAASSGRQNETEVIQPGNLVLTIDDSSGDYTPGRSTASCELTQNMPIFFTEHLGYRTFPIFTGYLQVPDAVEQLEGVDNLVTVTAVDAKALLDGGRTFISTLAEWIMYQHRGTLRQYYPLNEPAPPFLDVVGTGGGYTASETTSSLLTTTTARPSYTPAGGVRPPGDDVQGVEFEPTMTDAGGLGFPTIVAGHILGGSSVDFTEQQQHMVQVAAGEPVTMIVWASVTDEYDTQVLLSTALYDSVFANATAVSVSRTFRHASAGANAGLLEARLASAGVALTGEALTPAIWTGTGSGVIPFGVQFTFGPNTIKLWYGREEIIGSTPSGSVSAPGYITAPLIGPLAGSVAHLQLHVGDFSHDDFLAQYEAGVNGLAGQRTDERIATILSYASGNFPADLDEGSTWMQRANLAGQKPGQVINNAVQTERGRGFVGPDGVFRFHSRVRAYNL